eukprot:TRINITY_DN5399_c0_g1_i1.p1 TRINITY_DN5399_c0_g1~~TRINITY_DN5399_c0_g1_i1.p1  ORF type:complete len:227 (-),score=34.39 TRINITY_DN5399_c0_g1_i1:36-626(-)
MENLNKDLWKFEKKMNEFKCNVYSRTDKELGSEKLNTIKVEMECKCTKESFINLLHTKMTDRHGEWNKTYTGGEVIESFDDSLNVQYWQYNINSFFKNRDFLVVRRLVEMEDGKILIIDKSVEEHPKYDGKKYLRCELFYNIRVFSPQNEGLAKLYYMNKTDIGGSVPIFLCNSANVSVSSEEMIKICHILEKDSK